MSQDATGCSEHNNIKARSEAMKRNTRKVLLGAATLAAVAVAGGVKDADAANVNVSITAQILQPLGLAATQVMKFGKMTVKAGTGGTVTIGSGADTRAAGGAGGVSLVGGTGANRGGFKFTAGATGLAIDITGPTKATISAGANTMTVNAFKIGTKAIGATAFVTTLGAIPASGFRVGGTLNVGAAQAVGSYTGTVTITANYQ